MANFKKKISAERNFRKKLNNVEKIVREIFIRTSGDPEVLLRKGVLKVRSKFTGEHLCRSATSSCKATLLDSHFGMGVLL